MTQRRRVLGERYELDSVLGQGGMAKVFKGIDRVLGRTVAVKVLSPQFAGDAQFVARFRREAQAAAALNHPNIVSVFDTGDQGEVHYIVMEYVEGKTLRDVLRTEGPLLPQRAVEIGDSVARALGAAHRHGMVHRDIKPGNIMITDSGEVKVMDFGIARTSTGDTLTQTAAVLGTASYLSPEQAQGQAVDSRSDIYSLGCVLYEMLTGHPPFTGDSPVTIAYRHVRDDPVAPSNLNAEVGPDLENVVLKAMAKNPANRYQTADEMRQDLERLLQGLPTMATPLLGDATQALTRADGTQVMTEVPPEEDERKRRWVPVVVTILVLLALGLAAFFLIRSLSGETPMVRVPDVVGQDEDAAVAELERAGLRAEITRKFNQNVPAGEVIRQDPEAGQQVERGSQVNLVISRGAQQVEVPDVVGLSRGDAESTLQGEGFEVQVQTQNSEEPEDTVIDQDPDGGEDANQGSTVTIVVSEGPSVVEVPNVVCEPVNSARQRIQQAGLGFNVTGQQFSDECDQGTVATQNPSGGTQVAPGTTVNVTRSRGPQPSPTTPSP